METNDRNQYEPPQAEVVVVSLEGVCQSRGMTATRNGYVSADKNEYDDEWE